MSDSRSSSHGALWHPIAAAHHALHGEAGRPPMHTHTRGALPFTMQQSVMQPAAARSAAHPAAASGGRAPPWAKRGHGPPTVGLSAAVTR
jgi:hypothetical protein